MGRLDKGCPCENIFDMRFPIYDFGEREAGLVSLIFKPLIDTNER